MTTKSDTYKKRNCHKAYLRFMSMHKYYKESFEVLFHINSRICRFICYNQNTINYLKRCLPDEKLTLWFIIKSTKYNEKYYTDNILQYVLSNRLKTIDEHTEINNNSLFNSQF